MVMALYSPSAVLFVDVHQRQSIYLNVASVADWSPTPPSDFGGSPQRSSMVLKGGVHRLSLGHHERPLLFLVGSTIL